MRKEVLLTVSVLVCLIGSISVAQAGEETKIVPDQRLVVSTAIYGNLVTWYETSTNVPHIYDLSIGKELNVPDDRVESNMEIYGNRFVWQNGDDGVSLYDTSTKKLIRITEAYHPDIYGNNIVYERIKWLQDEPYTLHSLYIYNITTKKETKITGEINADYKTAISGNKVVWVRADNPSIIYIYDIPSKKVSTTSASDSVSNLDIYGNLVVWQSGSDEKSDIYMRDISIHKTIQITKSGSATEPAIYGNRIVYINANDIYVYDKFTRKTTRITSCGCAYAPSIYNNKVMYADSHEAGEMNWELGSIYLYDLSERVPKFKHQDTN